MQLSGRVAIVTGGASGVGRAVTRKMAEAGARVVIADINEADGSELHDSLTSEGRETTFVRCDVSREEEVSALVEATMSTYQQLDVLVNNVGIISRQSVVECLLEEWQHIFRTNVDSVFLTSKYAIPKMTAAGGGSIVNMSSLAALVGVVNRPAYCASKGAVSALTRQLAVDYAGDKIRVNAVAPSSIEQTGMYESRPDVREDAEAVKQSLFASHPLFRGLGRICSPEDVANVVLFLASDESAMVTGLTIPVDGGRTAAF